MATTKHRHDRKKQYNASMYTNAGCSRLVDYYFVVSCDDRGLNHIKDKLRKESLAPENEMAARHANFALKPKIIDRYPWDNHDGTPLLPWVARTSMPRGIRARTRPPSPTFFTFVGWNVDGSKLYGSCLMVFEKVRVHNQNQTVYIPKTLGFLSHYPYFCAFDVFLRCLWHVIPKNLIRLEDLLMHYFYDIPAPAPSRKIAYDLGQMQVLLACRNEFDVPILELPMETAFTQLSKDRICFILKLLLLEERVIFICSDSHQLTPVCELFVSLLFPLRWCHLYMPLVSHRMFQALMPRSGTGTGSATGTGTGSAENSTNTANTLSADNSGHTTGSKPKLNTNGNGRHRRKASHCSSRFGPDGGELHYRDDAPFIVGLPRFVYLNPDIQNNMPINSFLVFLDRNLITNEKKEVIKPKDMKSGRVLPNLPDSLNDSLTNSVVTMARILTMQVDRVINTTTAPSSPNQRPVHNHQPPPPSYHAANPPPPTPSPSSSNHNHGHYMNSNGQSHGDYSNHSGRNGHHSHRAKPPPPHGPHHRNGHNNNNNNNHHNHNGHHNHNSNHHNHHHTGNGSHHEPRRNTHSIPQPVPPPARNVRDISSHSHLMHHQNEPGADQYSMDSRDHSMSRTHQSQSYSSYVTQSNPYQSTGVKGSTNGSSSTTYPSEGGGGGGGGGGSRGNGITPGMDHNHNHNHHYHTTPGGPHGITPGGPSSSSWNSNTPSRPLHSVFVSRDYTLHAFRGVFAVMTKLLWAAAHKRYARGPDPHLNPHDAQHPQMGGPSDRRTSRHENQEFVVRFRKSLLFKAFSAYYQRLNGEHDPESKRIYRFYKDHEAHGKHFARRESHNWEGEQFDRKQYDREIFKIDFKRIQDLENANRSNPQKLRDDERIAKRRAKMFTFPIKEFEMLPEVKEFMNAYVWRERRRHYKTRSGDTTGAASWNSARGHMPISHGSLPRHYNGSYHSSSRRGSSKISINSKISIKSGKTRSTKSRHKKKRSKSRSLRNAAKHHGGGGGRGGAFDGGECSVDIHSIKGQESGNAAGNANIESNGGGTGLDSPMPGHSPLTMNTGHEKKESKISITSANSQDAVLLDNHNSNSQSDSNQRRGGPGGPSPNGMNGIHRSAASRSPSSGHSHTASGHNLDRIPKAMLKMGAIGPAMSQLPYAQSKRKGSNAKRKGSKSRRSSSKISPKSRRHKRGHSKTHTLNSSNVSDVVDGSVARKVEEFSQQLVDNKGDLNKQKELCLEMEQRIQSKIKLEVAKMQRQADVGSIDNEATRIGFQTKELAKGEDHWKNVVREVFQGTDRTQLLADTINAICGEWPEKKDDLTLLKSVVNDFDDQLTLMSMSVRSVFLHGNNGKQPPSDTSSTWDSNESDEDEDSDDDEDEDDEEEEESDTEDTGTTTEDSKISIKSNKAQNVDSDDSQSESEEEEDDDDDDEEEEEETESGSDDESDGFESSTSSSSWNTELGTEYPDDEFQQEHRVKIEGKFTKLDEFALDPELEEFFHSCQKMRTRDLGEEGAEYLEKHCNDMIGMDFVDDYLVSKWNSSWKRRLKQQHLMAKSLHQKQQQQQMSRSGSKRKLVAHSSSEQNRNPNSNSNLRRHPDSRSKPPPNSKGVTGNVNRKQRATSPKQHRSRLQQNGNAGHRGHGHYGRDHGRNVHNGRFTD